MATSSGHQRDYRGSENHLETPSFLAETSNLSLNTDMQGLGLGLHPTNNRLGNDDKPTEGNRVLSTNTALRELASFLQAGNTELMEPSQDAKDALALADQLTPRAVRTLTMEPSLQSVTSNHDNEPLSPLDFSQYLQDIPREQKSQPLSRSGSRITSQNKPNDINHPGSPPKDDQYTYTMQKSHRATTSSTSTSSLSSVSTLNDMRTPKEDFLSTPVLPGYDLQMDQVKGIKGSTVTTNLDHGQTNEFNPSQGLERHTGDESVLIKEELSNHASVDDFSAYSTHDLPSFPQNSAGANHSNGLLGQQMDAPKELFEANRLLMTPQQPRVDASTRQGITLSHQKPLELNREANSAYHQSGGMNSMNQAPHPFMMTINEASFHQSPQSNMGLGMGDIFSPSAYRQNTSLASTSVNEADLTGPLLDITNSSDILHSDLTRNMSSFNMNTSMNTSAGGLSGSILSPNLSSQSFLPSGSPDPNHLGVQNLSPMILSSAKLPTQAYFSNNRAMKFKQGVSAALRSPKVMRNPKLSNYLRQWADTHETVNGSDQSFASTAGNESMVLLDDPSLKNGPSIDVFNSLGSDASLVRKRRAMQHERMRQRGVGGFETPLTPQLPGFSPIQGNPSQFASPYLPGVSPILSQGEVIDGHSYMGHMVPPVQGNQQPQMFMQNQTPMMMQMSPVPSAKPLNTMTPQRTAVRPQQTTMPNNNVHTTASAISATANPMLQHPLRIAQDMPVYTSAQGDQFLAQHFMSMVDSPTSTASVGSYAVDQHSKIVQPGAANANGCTTGVLRNLRLPNQGRGATNRNGPPSALPKEVIQSLYDTILTQDQDGKPKKVYACLIDMCGRLFPRRTACESHIQTHLEDKPYACKHDNCNARFVRPHDLRRHERTHSSKRPFRCPCGKGFARGDALMRHRHRGICPGAFTEEEKRNTAFLEAAHQEAMRLARAEEKMNAGEGTPSGDQNNDTGASVDKSS